MMKKVLILGAVIVLSLTALLGCEEELEDLEEEDPEDISVQEIQLS